MSQTITNGQLDVLISYLRSVDTATLSFEGKEVVVKAFNYVMKTYDIPKIQYIHALIGPKVVECMEYMKECGYNDYAYNDYKNTNELFGAVIALFDEVIET